jgi:hypothetical protein
MSKSQKTKSDVVGVGCDDLLAQKRLALKAARRESKKAARRGRHNWGDFNRNQHIKELEREIQILRANVTAHSPQPDNETVSETRAANHPQSSIPSGAGVDVAQLVR